MNDFTGRVKRDEWRPPAGLRRTVTCALDTAQYQLDMDALAKHRGQDIYSTFNLLMRRKPKVRLATPLPNPQQYYDRSVRFTSRCPAEEAPWYLAAKQQELESVSSAMAICPRLCVPASRHTFGTTNGQTNPALGHSRLQENNFKAVLESMRDLMNEATVVPPWLHDTFLGYGDPAAAQYTNLRDEFTRSLDFKVRSIAVHVKSRLALPACPSCGL